MSNAILPIKAISRNTTATPDLALIQEFEDKLVTPSNNIESVLKVEQGVNNTSTSFDKALEVLSDFQDKKESITLERSLLMKEISDNQKDNFVNIGNTPDTDTNFREYTGSNTTEINNNSHVDATNNSLDSDNSLSGKMDMVEMAKKSAANIDNSLVLQAKMMDVSNKHTIHMTMFSVATSFITSIQNGFKKLIQM